MTFIGRDGRLKKSARRHHHRGIRLHRRRAIRRRPHHEARWNAARCSGALRGRCNVAMERCSVVLPARYIVGQPVRCSAELPVQRADCTVVREHCSRAAPERWYPERYNEVQ